MGCGLSRRNRPKSSTESREPHQRPRSARSDSEHNERRHRSPSLKKDAEVFHDGDTNIDIITKGTPFETISNNGKRPPSCIDMIGNRDPHFIFMIKPFKYDRSHPEREPEAKSDDYLDKWGTDHVRMPCSHSYVDKHHQPIWKRIQHYLSKLQRTCDEGNASFEILKETIQNCNAQTYDMRNLEILINSYSNHDRHEFMSTVLSMMCTLALNVKEICGQAPPLLGVDSNNSVTMSQRQAASLLACAFFCLFPFRSNQSHESEYEYFPDPNFHRLYQNGRPQKIEKLKCILHYFRRITEKMPTGVITFRRFALPRRDYPVWHESNQRLCSLYLTTGQKIENITNVLQADFANKFIGGGVLGSGCVQEEIRFSICPEMLVSLLVCERMETPECVFLIGCERYSSYKGYADSFQFDSDYRDTTMKDDWGRKWCHVVAMDAIFFRDRSTQYEMWSIHRELLKAYASFRPLDGSGANHKFGIATGNWGCGAFNGDKQLKAVIQLLAASEAGRPLIYAAYGDRRLVKSFGELYDYLCAEKVTVADLYMYLKRYTTQFNQTSLFEMIRQIPVRDIRPS